MKDKAVRLFRSVDKWINKIDSFPLWWTGFLLVTLVLIPNFLLGEGSVFTIHDQWDESMMNYVLTARHPGAETIPEMLGGINASGLEPSAVLFVIFYRLFSPFQAFLITYALMMLAGFEGMYLAIKKLTGSGILAVVCGGLFCMLPLYPVYGLSQMGIPLVLYAFLCLREPGKKEKTVCGLAMLLLFGLTSHLVYTGYVVLAFWLAGGILTPKGERKWVLAGFVELLLVYVLTNLNLFAEILFGRSLSGSVSYISHREEMVNSAMPFLKTVKEVFCSSAQHAPSLHKGLILPILLILVISGFFYKSREAFWKIRYRSAWAGMAVLFFIAVFYGICKSAPVTAWKNSVSGFLHYFQMERFYWLYPAGWYLEFGLAFSLWWTGRKGKLLKCMALLAVVLPVAQGILYQSYFYWNVNQWNNGSDITGMISWEDYYAEDLMSNIEQAIGRDISSYKVAHLGISPAPALMHGFYTVDGYSNNYPLSYKHAFRKVIAGELDKNQETAVYFDKWGNRCYLFNAQTGNYWMLKKGNDIQYEGLDFDMDALKDLGCGYLFSGAEIRDAQRMGLEELGYFETDHSYWGIWVYRL